MLYKLLLNYLSRTPFKSGQQKVHLDQYSLRLHEVLQYYSSCTLFKFSYTMANLSQYSSLYNVFLDYKLLTPFNSGHQKGDRVYTYCLIKHFSINHWGHCLSPVIRRPISVCIYSPILHFIFINCAHRLSQVTRRPICVYIY